MSSSLASSSPRLFAAFLGGLLGGCQHAAVKAPASGQSTFSFVESPPPVSQKSEAHIEVSAESARFRPPTITSDLASPAYPAAALAVHARTVTIDVVLTIGTAGRITDIAPNALDLAIAGPLAQEFEDAIEKAVNQWEFLPAAVLHFERGSSPGDSGMRLTNTELVPARIEVKFRFSQDDGVQLIKSGRWLDMRRVFCVATQCNTGFFDLWQSRSQPACVCPNSCASASKIRQPLRAVDGTVLS
jgi:hypothetical protein